MVAHTRPSYRFTPRDRERPFLALPLPFCNRLMPLLAVLQLEAMEAARAAAEAREAVAGSRAAAAESRAAGFAERADRAISEASRLAATAQAVEARAVTAELQAAAAAAPAAAPVEVEGVGAVAAAAVEAEAASCTEPPPLSVQPPPLPGRRPPPLNDEPDGGAEPAPEREPATAAAAGAKPTVGDSVGREASPTLWMSAAGAAFLMPSHCFSTAFPPPFHRLSLTFRCLPVTNLSC